MITWHHLNVVNVTAHSRRHTIQPFSRQRVFPILARERNVASHDDSGCIAASKADDDFAGVDDELLFDIVVNKDAAIAFLSEVNIGNVDEDRRHVDLTSLASQEADRTVVQ